MVKRIAIGLVLLFVAGYAAAAAAAAAPPKVTPETRARISRHLKYAERYLTQKDYDRALSEYRLINSWAVEPQNDFFLGRAYSLKGERAPALKHLRRYLALQPQGPHAAAATELLTAPAVTVSADAAPAPAADTQPPPVSEATATPTPAPAASAIVTPASPESSVKPTATAAPTPAPFIASPDALPPAPATVSRSEPGTAAPTTAGLGPEPAKKKPLYRRWWLWTIVGSAAAQGAVGAALGVTQSPSFQTTLPPLGRSLVGSF